MRLPWATRSEEAAGGPDPAGRPPTSPAPAAGRPVAEVVDGLVARIGRGPEAVIPLLQAIQNEYRYLPAEALRRVAEVTDITPAALAGVSSFYSQFRHHPVGRHVISICHGTACHVKGAQRVTEALYRHLGLEEGQDTDGDGVFTVQKVACLGCCTLAPVMQVDGVTYGHLTPDSVPQALEDFLELRRRLQTGRDGERTRPVGEDLAEIRIGLGSCCVAGGSADVGQALERAVRDLAVPAMVKPVGCVGICHQTPLVEVLLPGQEPVVYAKVQAADAEAIVRRHFRPRGLLRRARAAVSSGLDRLLTDESWEPVTRYALEVRDAPVCDFLGPQRRLVTEGSGCLNPLDLEEYEAGGGFAALRRVFGVAHASQPASETGEAQAGKPVLPEEILDTLIRSGLRGRGGAGFPTGVKFSLVRDTPSDVKYLVCNGDEGDPGAFMDRMLLESYPYRVLEGMIIAAYAVGAHQGFLYIRAEYKLAVQRLREALRRMEEGGCSGATYWAAASTCTCRCGKGRGPSYAARKPP